MDENLSRGYIQLGQASRLESLCSRPGGLGAGHPKAPKDPCSCIYLALVLAGVGFLLPYNSFIIAVDYYQHRFPGTTIVFDMSLVYILMAFLAVIVNNVLVETLSLNVRIGFGYILSFMTLLFVALGVIWYDVFDQQTAYNVNLIAVAVVALGCTGAAGLLISSNRILTKALMDDEKANTITFFVLSISIVWACFVVHWIVQKTEFVQFYIGLCSTANDNDDTRRITLEPTEDAGLVDILDAGEARNKYGVLTLHSPTAEAPDSAFQSSENIEQPPDRASPPDPGMGTTTYKVQDVVIRMRGTYSTAYTSSVRCWGGLKRGLVARWHVARSVWPFMLSIGLAYFVTLCLFPGIESEVVSCSLGNWMPVVLMAVFNLFDFIGKILAAIPYEWTRLQLVLCSLARILLVPLLVMCAAPRERPLIPGEGWALVFSLALGLSNGVFGSVPMIVAPTKVPDEHRELTGNIMTLSYSLGLTTGSGVAYILDAILGPPLFHPCDQWEVIVTMANMTGPVNVVLNGTT